MAYQDVKRALTRLSHPWTIDHDDVEHHIECFAQVYEAYNQLAQEVLFCHNSVQQFSVAIANGLATIAVTLPAPAKTVNYYVGAEFSFTNAGYWVTAKTVTGFTLNWTTVSVGAQTARILALE